MSTVSQPPIAVIGGGITGLVAAWRLHQQKRRVRLFVAAERLGGVIRSERSSDWLVEAGPNSVREDSPEITRLINQLNLDPVKIYPRPEAKNRWILRDGKLVAVPASPKDVLGSKLFGFGTKAKIAAEMMRRPKPRDTDVSLAELVRDHFGQEVVDYALNPFVSGVYAGNPEKLSARHAFPELWDIEQKHGSLLRGTDAHAQERRAQGLPSPVNSFTLANGLVALPLALADPLPAGCVEFNAKVDQIQPGHPWKLTWSRDGVTRTEEFESVILAVPAPALAKLAIGDAATRPLASLDSMEHASLSSFFLGYEQKQVTHPLDGFGLLIPAAEKRAILGVIFSSTVFVRRAPVGHVALTVMVGGTQRTDLTQLPPDRLLAYVRRDLAELLGVTGNPIFARHHVWPRAIPQYNLGHERFLDTMSQCEKTHPRLFIGGHPRDGIGLSACILSGLRLADKALA